MNEEIRKQLLHMIRVSAPDQVKIEMNECIVYVWFRPTYCDRGKIMLDVETKDPTRLTIDAADMFPRIYFLAENMVSELGEWAKARRQHVIEVIYKDRLDGGYASYKPEQPCAN